MKTIILTIIVFALAFNISQASPVPQDTLFQTKEAQLMLWNPQLIHGHLFVYGSLSLVDDHLLFKVNDESSFVKKSLKNHYRYNFLIKDIEIFYSKIRKIKRRSFVFLLFTLQDGREMKFGFGVKDRKKIFELLSKKVKP